MRRPSPPTRHTSDLFRDLREFQFNRGGTTKDRHSHLQAAVFFVHTLDHAVETDKRIERLLGQLEKAGVPVEDERAMADKFDPNYIGKIVD